MNLPNWRTMLWSDCCRYPSHPHVQYTIVVDLASIIYPTITFPKGSCAQQSSNDEMCPIKFNLDIINKTNLKHENDKQNHWLSVENMKEILEIRQKEKN